MNEWNEDAGSGTTRFSVASTFSLVKLKLHWFDLLWICRNVEPVQFEHYYRPTAERIYTVYVCVRIFELDPF